jgi:hypothetical protein
MSKIVIVHNVVDLDRWLSYKQERVDVLAQFGSSVTDHVAADGSKTVAVTVDGVDVAAMQAALASPPPELAAGMERHGVIPPLTVFVEK